ncbi:MAG TPA: CAP domain-containing protein [Kofleriaceae bacterium]|nr:CAP domain-containing protein [Kofleriaceae bacterium]
MRWLLVLAAGCALPPPAPPPPVTVPDVPVFPQTYVYGPDGDPLRYDEPLPPPTTTSFDDAVIAGTHATPDPRLFRALASLATIHDRLDREAVEVAWSYYGVIEPVEIPKVFSDDDPQAVVTALGTLSPHARIGIGHRGTTAIVAITTPEIEIKPLARTAAVDAGFVIDAKAEAGVTSPQVKVVWSDGTTQKTTPTFSRRAFQVLLACQNRSVRGDVTIVDAANTLAQFPVWCGTAPPRSVTIDPLHDPSGDHDPDHAAHRLFTMLQRERVTAGAYPLVWDDRVAAQARKRADEVRAGIESGAGPKFTPSGIIAASVVENMAVAPSIDDAFTRLMANRERRDTAMSPQMTGSGVGVALGADGQVYVSQIFVHTPGKISGDWTARDLERRIHDADSHLVVDGNLTEVAKDIAPQVIAGLAGRKMTQLLVEAGSRVGYGELKVSMKTTVDLASMEPRSLITAPNINRFGIAVMQGHHPKVGDNAIWIVVVMGHQRL